MRRLFCYTLSARAIGATVSAGALHAQGWGFESLIAHHLFDNGSRKGIVFLGTSQRDSNPSGCGAEETRSVFQRSTRGAKRRSESGRRSRTRYPSSPTICLITVLERGPFLFGHLAEGFEPVRVRSRGNAQAFSSAAREERSDEAEAGGEIRPWRMPLCKKCQI